MSVLNFLELAEGGEALPQRSVAALDFDGKVPVSSPRPVTALDLSEKVSASSPTRPKTKPTITKPTAPSELLQRLSAFLPEIQRANDELSQKDSRTFNIEFDEESEAEQMIELNLGLGVFEQQTPDGPKQEELCRLRLPGEEARKRPLAIMESSSSDEE